MRKTHRTSDHIDVHYKTGVRLFDEENYQAAIKEFRIYIRYEANPTIDSYLYLGKSLFLTEQCLAAILPLSEFVKKSETSNLPYAYDVLGQCYFALGDFKNTKRCYQSATQLDPTCASAWHNWGILYMALLEKMTTESEEVNFAVAIHCYQEALHCNREQSALFKKIVHFNLAECFARYGHYLYQSGDYEAALRQYLAALENNDAHLPALNQAGMCYFKQGLYKEAITWFFQILEKTEDTNEHADAWLNIACSYRWAGDFEKALEAIIRAKELAPDDAAIREEEKNIILISDENR